MVNVCFYLVGNSEEQLWYNYILSYKYILNYLLKMIYKSLKYLLYCKFIIKKKKYIVESIKVEL